MELITVKAAAVRIGKTEGMVRKLVAEGKLKSRLENRRHMIDADELRELYQIRASIGATRSGAVAKTDTSGDASSAQVVLLERQVEMILKENEFLKTMLAEERAAKRALDAELTSVLREIRAFMQTGNDGIVSGLTRFFRK
jgi:hypothetical protein